MIEVNGEVTLKVRYSVKLNMTLDEFESLSTRKQNELLDGSIDWHNELRNAETDDIEVWDIDEI